MRFFDELKRRNVFRVAGVYFIVAATMIQLIPPLVDAFDLPRWSNTFVFLMLAIVFPITILVTWAFEMTPEGLRRTEEAAETVRLLGLGGFEGGERLLGLALLQKHFAIELARGREGARRDGCLLGLVLSIGRRTHRL